MIDCHVHLWDLGQGHPWIRPGSPHHRTFTAAEAAARHTGLTVIVDHLGNPANPAAADPGEWREQVRRAAGESGVVMKISGPLTQQHGVPEGRRTAWHYGRTYGVRLTTIGGPASMHRLTIDKR